MEKLYKIKEVREYLRVSQRWLEDMIKDGKISIVKLGGVRRIKESELKRLVQHGIE